MASMINVKACSIFGAVGDGINDDTVAFQTAVNAGNGDIYVPPGSYRITNTIHLSNRQSFVGEGFSSNIIADTDVLFAANGRNNISIRRLHISGKSARLIELVNCTNVEISNCCLSGATLPLASGQPSAAVFLDGVSDITVTDCTFKGNGIGASVARSADLMTWATLPNKRICVRGNTFLSDSVHFAVQISNASYCSVENNQVVGQPITDSSNNSGYGIVVYGLGETDTHHIRVVGNVVMDTQGSGIYIAGAQHCIVHDNVLERTCTVQTVANSLPIGGIVVNGNPGDGNCSVIGNNVIDQPRHGIVINKGHRHIVANNIVLRCVGAGIAITHTSNFCVVSGNVIDDCDRCIWLYPNPARGLSIVGNITTRARSTPGIQAQAHLSASVVAANVCVDNGGEGASVLLGTQNLISSNTCVGNGLSPIRCDPSNRLLTGNLEIS